MAAATICSYFQFNSVAQSCPTLCDPMDCSMPGLPVHHQENKVCHCFHCFPIYWTWMTRLDAMIFIRWMFSFKLAFLLSSFTFIKGLFSTSSLSADAVICISEVIDISPSCLDSSFSFIQPSILHGIST